MTAAGPGAGPGTGPGSRAADRRPVDVEQLVAAATGADPAQRARAVGRLISLVEDASPALREVMGRLAPYAGATQVVGLTGAPGVGKSTSTSALVGACRRQGRQVGVLAVDPSSPFSGGALLGDRVRMQEHATDDGVFIRSMANRGQLGGLSWATPQAVRVLAAAGCDVVLVETVGVGQAEVDVAHLADTTVVLLAPGLGDGVQAAKAGILEVADVLVVNKADLVGADSVVRHLRHMQSLAPSPTADGGWVPPIVRTVASSGEGVDELADRIDAHGSWLAERGELDRRRRRRAAREVEALAVAALRSRLGELPHGRLDRLAEQVVRGELDPYTAADDLVAEVTAGS